MLLACTCSNILGKKRTLKEILICTWKQQQINVPVIIPILIPIICPPQLDEMIQRTEEEYLRSELPTDLTHAESMLETHKRKKTEVSQLINYTAEEGDMIVRRVRQQVRFLYKCHLPRIILIG